MGSSSFAQSSFWDMTDILIYVLLPIWQLMEAQREKGRKDLAQLSIDLLQDMNKELDSERNDLKKTNKELNKRLRSFAELLVEDSSFEGLSGAKLDGVLTNRIKELKSNAEHFENIYGKSVQENGELLSELAKRKEAHLDDIKKLGEELRVFDDDQKELLEALTEQCRKVNDLRQEKNDLAAQKTSLEDGKTKLSERLKSMEAEYGALQAQFDELSLRSVGDNDSLREEVVRQKRKRETLWSARGKAMAEKESVTHQNITLLATVEELKKDHTYEQKRLRLIVAQKHAEEVTKLTKDNDRLRQEVKKLNAELQDICVAQDNLRRNKGSLEHQNRCLREAVRRTEEGSMMKQERLRAQVVEAAAKLLLSSQEQAEERARVEEEHSQLRKLADTFQMRCLQLEQECEELRVGGTGVNVKMKDTEGGVQEDWQDVEFKNRCFEP